MQDLPGLERTAILLMTKQRLHCQEFDWTGLNGSKELWQREAESYQVTSFGFQLVYFSISQYVLVRYAILSKWHIAWLQRRVELVKSSGASDHGSDAVPFRLFTHAANMKTTAKQNEAVDLTKKAHEVVRQGGHDCRSLLKQRACKRDVTELHGFKCDG